MRERRYCPKCFKVLRHSPYMYIDSYECNNCCKSFSVIDIISREEAQIRMEKQE